MKRDWELIREILAALEGQAGSDSVLNPTDLADRPVELVSGHIYIMDQAGLIEAACKGSGRVFCIAKNLTWEGHELYDQIRTPETWERIKARIAEKGLPLTHAAIRAAVTARIEAALSRGDG